MGRAAKAKGQGSEQRGRRLTLAKGLRFSCRQCGDCCRSTPVLLTGEEVARYDARDWTSVLGYPAPLVHDTARVGGMRGQFLRRKQDGTCLFLGPDALCEIHRHLGEAEKPLTCRVFPFRFVPGAGEGPPLVGAQFACSSIAAGDGEALSARRRGLEELQEEVARQHAQAPRLAPVRFAGPLSYAPEQVEELLDLMVKELEDAGRPFPERFLAVVKFTSLVAGSKLERLDAGRDRPLVSAFAEGIHEQARRGLLRPRPLPPSLPERILFRQLLAMGVRRDPAWLLRAGFLRRATRRLGNLLAGLTFMAGSGVCLPVGRERRVALGEVRRRAPPADPYSPEADGALTRYFVAQLSGRVLLSSGFAVPELLPALGLLFRQLPIVLLLARAACLSRGGSELTRDDYASALRGADWNFGRVPWTAGPIGRVRARLLGDVEACFQHLAWCAVPPAAAGGAPPALPPPGAQPPGTVS